MTRARLTVMLVALVGLMVPGCSKEKQQLRETVAAQADSIDQLQARLRAQSDSLVLVVDRLAVVEIEVDSIAQGREEAGRRARQLSSQLDRWKRDYAALETTQVRMQAQRDSLERFHTQSMADTASILGDLRSENADIRDMLSRREALVDSIQPWYEKWRHDATTRSFVEVLFGSGRAPKPDFPEPDLTAMRERPVTDFR